MCVCVFVILHRTTVARLYRRAIPVVDHQQQWLSICIFKYTYRYIIYILNSFIYFLCLHRWQLRRRGGTNCRRANSSSCRNSHRVINLLILVKIDCHFNYCSLPSYILSLDSTRKLEDVLREFCLPDGVQSDGVRYICR